MGRDRLQKVRDISDELLRALRELKAKEARKREVDISSPEFHERAEDVERQAEYVFRLATRETDRGNDVPQETEVSTEEVPPSRTN